MKRPRFFTLEELLTSSTARQRSIENLPSWTVVEHLNDLAMFLDDIRNAYGSALRVTSGFRNQKLNTAVSGVKNSAHMCGMAADLVPVNGDIAGFEKFLRNWLPTYEGSFDQCIFESKGKSRWVHIAQYSPSGGQRRQLFGMTVPIK